MYSNPTYDPNPLVSQNLATETTAWNTLPAHADQAAVRQGTRWCPGLRACSPPGSSFKVITASAVLRTPRPGQDDLPAWSPRVRPAQLGHAPPGPDQLSQLTSVRREPRALLSSPVTPTSPRSGSCSGPRPWSTRPRPTASTSGSPSTCPRTPWPSPTSGPPPLLRRRHPRPDEVGHRPGERHRHPPLQMAMVAGGGGQRRGGDDPPRDGPDP